MNVHLPPFSAEPLTGDRFVTETAQTWHYIRISACRIAPSSEKGPFLHIVALSADKGGAGRGGSLVVAGAVFRFSGFSYDGLRFRL